VYTESPVPRLRFRRSSTTKIGRRFLFYVFLEPVGSEAYRAARLGAEHGDFRVGRETNSPFTLFENTSSKLGPSCSP